MSEIALEKEQTDKKRVLIFVVSYKAEKFIRSVLARIPESLWTNPYFETEVLVIDDESAIREITRETLESYGYKVLSASDGAEGVAR